jgi:RNA polymerase sigma factor (sigma-70 family)
MGIPRQDAEDVLQQCFLAFVKKAPGIENVEPWLVGTLRRECLMYWRRRYRSLYDNVDRSILEQTQDVRDQGSPESEAIRHDLDKAIGKTSNRCRQVLRLRYRLGYENQEVAEKLGYEPSGMRKIVSRCIAALSQCVLFGDQPPRTHFNLEKRSA